MLRGYTSRLAKREKLCTKFCSPSNLKRATPSIHTTNIRLIQSFLFNNNKNPNSISKISPFASSYHHSNNYQSTQQLFYFNHRNFSC